MEFVRPVREPEETIARLAADVEAGAGRLLFLLGRQGMGKSTFLASLAWREHVGFSNLETIDCSEFDPDERLDSLYKSLQTIAASARADAKLRAVSVDYMENISEFSRESVKAFFRSLNGLLRKSPLFIIWPVVDRADADAMIEMAAAVSGTMFSPGEPILQFAGPPVDRFPQIAKTTISVLNDGLILEDFGLTDADLTSLCKGQPSIREYLQAVVGCWKERSGYLEHIREQVPRQAELWFVVSYPGAEGVTSQFSRRSEKAEEAWTAFHSRLWEYIPGTQKAAQWDAKRLQLAIGGLFTTRILYLPSNALVSAVLAHAPADVQAKIKLEEVETVSRWSRPSTAREFMSTSLLRRLLIGEKLEVGKRKSGPASEALKAAEAAYEKIASFTTGSGHDRHINRAVAKALKSALPGEYAVEAEKPHPWVPNVTPDISVDMPDGRIVSIESCYTRDKKPSTVSSYVLRKLNTYMEQAAALIDK